LDTEVVAKRLGIHERSLYRLMQQRRIGYTQVTKRKRVITEAQLEEYIAAHAVPAEAV